MKKSSGDLQLRQAFALINDCAFWKRNVNRNTCWLLCVETVFQVLISFNQFVAAVIPNVGATHHLIAILI